MSPSQRILVGHVIDRLREIGDRSIHCAVCSPPYWNLRAYGTEPQIWDGDPSHDHTFGEETTSTRRGTLNVGFNERWGNSPGEKRQEHASGLVVNNGAFCSCGAWRGELGQEPTVALFVAHLVAVFAEVHRTLRDDGTLWLNIADSYAGSWGAQSRRETPATISRNQIANHPKKASHTGTIRDSGLKEKDLCLVPQRLAIALQDFGWYVRSIIIWAKTSCLSGGTRVYAKTQKGEMPTTIKDLARLDPATVQLWNGSAWTQVTAFTQAPDRTGALELEFRNGERIGCTPEHLWPTNRGLLRADEVRAGDRVESVKLPDPERMVAAYHLQSEVGWFVGMFLAEGFRTNQDIIISGHVNETARLTRLQRFAESFHGTCRLGKSRGNAANIHLCGPVLEGILDAYVSGEGAKGKHLHPRCWQRDRAFIDGILDGYLEGDGHRDPNNDRWRVSFANNDALAADLRTVAARLGYSLRLRRCMHQNGQRRFPGWRGELRRVRSAHHNTKHDGEIVAIRQSRARKFWDISVADEPHTFALASGLLTHNCMPESVQDRPTTAHEYILLLSKQPTYFYDAEAVRERVGEPVRMAASFRDGGVYTNHRSFDNSGDQSKATHGDGAPSLGGRNLRSVWTIGPEPCPDAHFATFVSEIPRRAILAGTSETGCCSACGAPWRRVTERRVPPSDVFTNRAAPTDELIRSGSRIQGQMRGQGQKLQEWREAHPTLTVDWLPSCRCDAGDPIPSTVLDPFSGSGTTGVVAAQLGRNYVGIELSENYALMSRRRIEREGSPLFSTITVEANGHESVAATLPMFGETA